MQHSKVKKKNRPQYERVKDSQMELEVLKIKLQLPTHRKDIRISEFINKTPEQKLKVTNREQDNN
jgi:hypothetical protein